MTEEEVVKMKIDAIMKAKAKEYARARFESEKKKQAEVINSSENKPVENETIEEAVYTVSKVLESKKQAEAIAVIETEPAKEEKQEQKEDISDTAAIAAAYAKYLKEHNLKPGDATFVDPAEIGVILEKEKPVEPIEFSEDEISAAVKKADEISEAKTEVILEEPKAVESANDIETVNKENKEEKAAVRKYEKKKDSKFMSFCAAPVYFMDFILDKISDAFDRVYQDFVIGAYKIARGYRHSQKQIGIGLLSIVIVCGIVVILLDMNTVYEYAYNGKALGYVDRQEDVTNVLAIAGEKLNSVNKDTTEDIEFTAGDNITFDVVESSGKDIDDADATVNKLAYMTDIEVEAYGIYDGKKLVTIVKSETAAERLLSDVKAVLGTPDEGMEVVSVEFSKPLEILPIKVLLTSVQSNTSAKRQMTKGGEVEFYHLVEKDETISDITADFGVSAEDIYDENNEEPVTTVDAGDKICIHKDVQPVSVKLVEKGKMKEIVPYETIKKKTKKYYIGDEVEEVEGVDGVQIFEGTLTKVGGKVTERDTESLEVIRKKVDKVVYVGTTKRPKTAPTGTFHNPMIKGTYVVTSWPGARWGRTHEGYDLGASTGTPVYASDGGTVSIAGVYGAYGNCIQIEHSNGWVTRYGHLSYIDVNVGDKVYQGQYIGDVGSTGRSTGPHLHFETRKDGAFVDPTDKVEGGF